MKELTDKQKRFAEEYLIDLNATQAAIRAGYTDGTYGRQFLTFSYVLEHIEKLQKERSERTRITQIWYCKN